MKDHISFSDTKKRVPTPYAVPVIGNAIEFSKDPLSFFKRISTLDSSVVELNMLHLRWAVICDPDLAFEILTKYNHLFPKGKRDCEIVSLATGRGILTINDTEHHKKQRAIVQPSFTPAQLKSYIQSSHKTVLTCFQDLEDGKSLDISRILYRITLLSQVKIIFNVDADNVDHDPIEISDAVTKCISLVMDRFKNPINPPMWIPTKSNREILAGRQHVVDTLVGLLSTSDDVMEKSVAGLLLSEDSLTDSELLDQLVTLFGAGYETTAVSASWTFYYMLSNPDVFKRVKEEVDQYSIKDLSSTDTLNSLEYTFATIKEALRIAPPAWVLMDRETAEDVTVNNIFFPKNTKVMIAPYIYHHQEKNYPAPDKFDPERFLSGDVNRKAYMPFSFGARTCIGNSLAFYQLRLIVSMFVKTYDMKLDGTPTIDIEPSMTLKNKHPINVILSKRENKA